MYKSLYSRFLEAPRLHFAAHSHHLWMDVSRDAHLAYWDDSAKYADSKWDKIFGEVIPEAQRHIARILNLSDPNLISFAPNTHEFLVRLLSCFEGPIKILTTDGEFHSFRRQIARYEELGRAQVTRLPVEPFKNFEDRFSKFSGELFDIAFLSQVFFESGYVIQDLAKLVKSLKTKMIVIDGYHGFCAIPTDLREIEDRIFYIGGGYKYAQSGEGVCFMAQPKDTKFKPANTGWFADFGNLTAKQLGVPFSDDCFRFWGATFDPSGIYRFNATMKVLPNISEIHEYVVGLQDYFLSLIPSSLKHNLLKVPGFIHAHFLTFRSDQSKNLYEALKHRGVVTDLRGDNLRVGFGMYQDRLDVEKLVATINEILSNDC